MDGVTVLNVFYEEVTSKAWAWSTGIIVMLVACGIFLLWVLYGFVEGDVPVIIVGLLFGALFLAGSIATARVDKVIEKVPIYEVVISEDVSFIEFNNKYEVIEQRGDIFVIKDRPIKDNA